MLFNFIFYVLSLLLISLDFYINLQLIYLFLHLNDTILDNLFDFLVFSFQVVLYLFLSFSSSCEVFIYIFFYIILWNILCIPECFPSWCVQKMPLCMCRNAH